MSANNDAGSVNGGASWMRVGRRMIVWPKPIKLCRNEARKGKIEAWTIPFSACVFLVFSALGNKDSSWKQFSSCCCCFYVYHCWYMSNGSPASVNSGRVSLRSNAFESTILKIF